MIILTSYYCNTKRSMQSSKKVGLKIRSSVNRFHYNKCCVVFNCATVMFFTRNSWR